MRILALDFGTQRCGLAVSDPTGALASPLPFLARGRDADLVRAIEKVAQEQRAARLLVGLPRHLNGALGASAEKVQAFVKLLERMTRLQVELVDERLSTVQASRHLHEAGRDARAQRERIDSAAACVLLQAYLDARAPLPELDPTSDA